MKTLTIIFVLIMFSCSKESVDDFKTETTLHIERDQSNIDYHFDELMTEHDKFMRYTNLYLKHLKTRDLKMMEIYLDSMRISNILIDHKSEDFIKSINHARNRTEI